MYQVKHGRNVGLLCTLIVLAVLLIVALRIVPTPPDRRLLVGGLTVVFGLYVGSRPAANMIDILMFDRYMLRRKSTRAADLAWVGLNVLTVVVAWLMIVEGTTRFLTAGR
jgi:hypothetical protein